MTRVLFHRDYRGFQGGHLKVRHYYEHVKATPGFSAAIYFSPDSLWNKTNPWHDDRQSVVADFGSRQADLLFLAGMDWLALQEPERNATATPKINLLQHLRHADPQHPLYRFLVHPALRICVSAEVAQAVVATGRAQGPVFTIPNGLDPAQPDHAPESERPISVLVAGLKQPALAEQIAERLVKDVTCRALTSPLPRPHYLDLVASSRIAVFLPNAEEGFYLPALEAMQRKTLVICPDCRGNRSFCRDGDTCLMPVSDVGAIVGAVKQALTLSAPQRLAMCDRAYALSTAFTLDAERRHFQTILCRSMELWTESFGHRGE